MAFIFLNVCINILCAIQSSYICYKTLEISCWFLYKKPTDVRPHEHKKLTPLMRIWDRLFRNKRYMLPHTHTHTCAFRQVRLNSRSSHNVSPQSHNRSTRVHVLHIFGTNSLTQQFEQLNARRLVIVIASVLYSFYVLRIWWRFQTLKTSRKAEAVKK